MPAQYIAACARWTAILFCLCIIFTASLSAAENLPVYTITLKPEPVDDYQFPSGGPVVRPRKANDNEKELIIKFPEGMHIKYTYTFSLQRNNDALKTFCEDAEARDRYFGRVKDETFEAWQQMYTTDPVDHYVSACIVQDADSALYMIFDENNDEDLSNDALRRFQSKTITSPITTKDYTDTYSDAVVTIDYYDGNTVQQTTYGIRFHMKKQGYGFISSVTGYFGVMEINRAQYMIGISKQPGVEFSKYENLWVDVNLNNRYDYGIDFMDQLYLPMTIGNRTYQLKDIPRFGGSLTLEVCDPTVAPPVGIGLPAPDFTETNYDSTAQVTLSDYKGKYVALNFWSCDGSFGLAIINKVHQKFKEREDFQILSIGPYSPQYLRGEAKDIPLAWPHVHGLFEVHARTLYQVSGHNVTFLIGPDGKILDKRIFAQADELITMVEKHIK